MDKRNIKVLILDDDPNASSWAKEQISFFVPQENIGIASNAVEFIRNVNSSPVDLIFLDIEMPQADGFAVAQYLQGADTKAKYVFLTGHPEAGARSYDFEPVDFLCKPVSRERLAKTFERYDKSTGSLTGSEKIAIEGTDGFELILPSDISYITRENRKTVLYLGQERKTVKGTLEEMELVLSEYGFFRCHQSCLIPINKIKSIKQSDFGRTFTALLSDGTKVPVSRQKYHVLRSIITERGIKLSST